MAWGVHTSQPRLCSQDGVKELGLYAIGGWEPLKAFEERATSATQFCGRLPWVLPNSLKKGREEEAGNHITYHLNLDTFEIGNWHYF